MHGSPPYRADHVGSFLRTAEVLEARRDHDEGRISAVDLRAIEDSAISELVAMEEQAGLVGITDGEFRRRFFHTDFLEQLDGVTVREGSFLASFRKDDGTEIGFKPPDMRVTGPIRHAKSIQGEDYDFLASVVTKTPKVAIPSPSMLHFRGGRGAVDEDVYPDLDPFFDDLGAAYREEIADLAARGATYIQLDDTNLAYLCDPEIRERTAARGDDPDELTHLYCRMVNDAVRDRPDGVTAAIHLCRGNYRSAWVSQGGYEPVGEILFNEMEVDAFFLEYDDDRSGDFAPLRHLPAGKSVVLGLMSSKKAEVDDADAVKHRLDEAFAYVDQDQVALSHQCGFASTSEGNELSHDDQWRKVEQTVAIAGDVWGDT